MESAIMERRPKRDLRCRPSRRKPKPIEHEVAKMANLAGVPQTQVEVNRVWGSIARDFLKLLERVRANKIMLDQFTDAQLAALPTGGGPAGFDQTDGANIKSAAGDLAQLVDIAEGAATLGVAKDFRTFTKRLAGFESVG